ncbi:Predicted secreted protein [Loktanella atrilutea]|uniref:Predicted secreted protein n=1 Tax=Loktanella atrilutea TaxID=366533 RepID=A0A1M5DKX0_LOKAT|nr:phage tail tube protein [Loktanella atrilutea]SHF67545.1 Predicted secreted protein [Loktanella atrilutea]
MPKQNARELLVKLGTEVVAGLTTRTINLNGNLVDITSINTAEPGGTVWREVIAGIQMLDIDGNGYFEDKTQAVSFIDAKNDGTYLALEIIVPGLGSFTGNFAVGNMGLAGELEGAVTMTIQLQSSGAVVFTPAVA